MEEKKDVKESKGMGSGILVGIVIGIALFMFTVQLLYMAK